MTVFLDTSALVKLFVPEVDHELVRSAAAPTIGAELATVEFPAAMWRKHRTGECSAETAQVLSRAFRIAVGGATPQIHLVQATPAILSSAALLVARHPLRACDAVQLASALAAGAVAPDCRFGSFDRQLNAAAAAEGLPLAF